MIRYKRTGPGKGERGKKPSKKEMHPAAINYMQKKNIAGKVLVILLFVVALALILYPYVANYLFEHRTESTVNAIEAAVEKIGDSKRLEATLAAKQYNLALASSRIRLTDPFAEEQLKGQAEEYNSLLCMTEDGVMGTIEIPAIKVSLPIYHGTEATVLEKGVGHLHGTSLPVGGSGTHAVLTGHTGLSNKKLFTDLTELVEGDIFLLNIMGEKLAYKVDQIKVVLPTELDDLYVTNGKDYCTLITCTPYGVNTHRLLVRGERTDYEEVTSDPELMEAKVTSNWMREYRRAIMISVSALLIMIIIACIKRKITGRQKQHKVADKTDKTNEKGEQL